MMLNNSWVPRELLGVAHMLHEAGHECYLVGGAVRDHLLHSLPQDFDLVSDATMGKLSCIFPGTIHRRGHYEISVLSYAGKYFEVAQLPQLGNSTPLESVLAADARSRDFTLNALYFDLLEERIFDPVGGLVDLDSKRLVPILTPVDCIHANPLVMLRAIRMSQRHNLRIDSEFERILSCSAPLLTSISVDRLLVEFNKQLTGGHALGCVHASMKYKMLQFLWSNLYELLNHEQTKKYSNFVLKKIDENIAKGATLSLPAIICYLLWGNLLDTPLKLSRIEAAIQLIFDRQADRLEIGKRFALGIKEVFSLQIDSIEKDASPLVGSQVTRVVAKNLREIRYAYENGLEAT